MEQIVNKAYKDLFLENYRYNILPGGRGAGRSTVASQYALAKLIAPEYSRIAIMRFVHSNIRNSIYQDILDRAEEQEVKDLIEIKDNILTFQYGANKITGIGFRKSSSDQKSKLKSLASYNCVIIEEADEVAEEDFMQLDDSLRTVKGDIKVILCLNPPGKNHWIIKRWFNLVNSGVEGFYKPELKESYKNKVRFFYTNWEANRENLNLNTIENYEHYKEINPDYYHNMIRGLVSEGGRGRIFKNWKPISVKEFEELPYPSIFGLDFGFASSPSALTEVKIHNNKVWVREWIYQTGLTNQGLSRRMEELGVPKNAEIYADSAEPKSIEELNQEGWNIMPSQKGQDSIRAGIDKLLGMEVYYTEDSHNIVLEIQEYKWALDKNKEPTNKPIDEYNHCFVYDTNVITRAGNKKIGEIKKGDEVLTRNGYRKVVKKWNNGFKQVVKYCLQIDTKVLILECTPDHLILTQEGWIKISQLKSGMTIFLTKNLMEKSTNYTQGKDIFQEGVKGCTKQFGVFITAKKIVANIKYIIKMVILGIIESKTWNWLKKINIYQNTEREDGEKIQSGLKTSTTRGLLKLKSGIKAKKEENGTQNTLRKHSKKENIEPLYVKCVGENTRQDIWEVQNIAIKTAKLKHLERGEEKKKEVFDLTVEDYHEYFANGVLVHNCIDSVRYSVMTHLNKPFIGIV